MGQEFLPSWQLDNRLEAHMIRTNLSCDRGRPFGPEPVFLADCVRLDALPLLARSRGARLVGTDDGSLGNLSTQWTIRWTEDGREQRRDVTLTVTATPQPFGGVRYWWRCPACQRRCRVLIAIEPTTTIACRVCHEARYLIDYPARDRRRRFVAYVHTLGTGDVDADRELNALLARRRRGVRRGRRVRLRAARALARSQTRSDRILDILTNGVL